MVVDILLQPEKILSNTTDPVVVYVTTPDMDCARSIADALVAQHLAACVNIVPTVESIYRWQGQVEHATETLLVIKTRAGHVAAIEDCLTQLHPDDVPECIALPIIGGAAPYLHWLAEQTGRD